MANDFGATRKPPDLRGLLDRIDQLPTIPAIAERVGQMVHDPKCDAHAIAAVMKGDPALTAKVLRVVNSPYYAIPGGVSEVTRAISFLGFNSLYQLVLTVSVFKVLGPASEDSAKRLFRHSLAAAGAAEAVAEILNHPAPAECFTAGLLHDLGKLALLQVAPDVFQQTETLVTESQLSSHEAERQMGAPHHDAIGLRLARKWRFPLPLQVAIGHHHAETAAQRHDAPRNLHSLIDIVVLADIICKRWNLNSADAETPDLPPDILERLNLTHSIHQKAYDLLRFKMERSNTLMEIIAK